MLTTNRIVGNWQQLPDGVIRIIGDFAGSDILKLSFLCKRYFALLGNSRIQYAQHVFVERFGAFGPHEDLSTVSKIIQLSEKFEDAPKIAYVYRSLPRHLLWMWIPFCRCPLKLLEQAEKIIGDLCQLPLDRFRPLNTVRQLRVREDQILDKISPLTFHLPENLIFLRNRYNISVGQTTMLLNNVETPLRLFAHPCNTSIWFTFVAVDHRVLGNFSAQIEEKKLTISQVRDFTLAENNGNRPLLRKILHLVLLILQREQCDNLKMQSKYIFFTAAAGFKNDYFNLRGYINPESVLDQIASARQNGRLLPDFNPAYPGWSPPCIFDTSTMISGVDEPIPEVLYYHNTMTKAELSLAIADFEAPIPWTQILASETLINPELASFF